MINKLYNIYLKKLYNKDILLFLILQNNIHIIMQEYLKY